MDLKLLAARLKKFFREDVSEIIGAYFDGEKIFVVRLTEKFETVEIEADDSDFEYLAEKISLVCTQKGWKTSAVGFCLREGDAITFQTEDANVPTKEIPSLVKSWAMAHAGEDAKFSFAKTDEKLWMETLPRSKVEEILAAFRKFNMNLRGLSVMPADLLTKISPFDRTEFITEVVRQRKTPNLLASRDSLWNWKKISFTAAAIILIVPIIFSLKLFFDYREVANKLDAANKSVEELSAELALKENIDADIAELHKLNKFAAQIESEKIFNLLINVGRISEGDVRLTKIRADKNLLELEGVTDTPAAVRNYLARVKNSVIKSARLESSSERDDGKIAFVIRATL